MPFRWRPDGDLVTDIPLVRWIMPYIMKTRSESTVLFEQRIDTRKTTAWLEAFRARTGLRATLLHLVVWSLAHTLQSRPRLNRFTAGGRIFQRRGIWVSFSAKKAKSDEHPIVVVKRRIDPALSFESLVKDLEAGISEGRSNRRSATDTELRLAHALPSFMVAGIVRLLRWLDQAGWLPNAFMESDPMFCSVFVAPLGSINLDAGFHHLFEYGNCPIFLTMGRNQDEVVVSAQGQPAVEPRMILRFTFDERIEDGLYCAQSLEQFKTLLENPEG